MSDSFLANRCNCGSHYWQYTSLWCIAIVDHDDSHLLDNYKWTAQGDYLDRAFYAYSRRYANTTGNSKYLHQAVTKHIHERIDHKDGNGHNCQKNNLNPITAADNIRKSRGYPNRTSQYRGVTRKGNKWLAQITVDRQNIYLGLFVNEALAAIAYNDAAVIHFGKYARVNIVESQND